MSEKELLETILANQLVIFKRLRLIEDKVNGRSISRDQSAFTKELQAEMEREREIIHKLPQL